MNRVMTRDSQLAYYVSQLENFDPTLHEPLVNVTWGRDIKLRSGVSFADEATSFTRTTFAAAGTLENSTSAMSWISPDTNALVGIAVNGEKVVLPLHPAGRQVSYTSIELEKSIALGNPIDKQKLDGLNLKYQLETDQMVYVGDSFIGATGLLNSSLITAGNVPNGASGFATWAKKTEDEILADVNEILTSVWEGSAFALCPDTLLLPPAAFSLLVTRKVSSAGNMSLLKYIKENSIALNQNGRELEINSTKWLVGLGTSTTNRMMAYTNAEKYVRFPMVPIRRETPYYLGITFNAPYIWALGEVEFVYPETAQYRDGI